MIYAKSHTNVQRVVIPRIVNTNGSTMLLQVFSSVNRSNIVVKVISQEEWETYYGIDFRFITPPQVGEYEYKLIGGSKIIAKGILIVVQDDSAPKHYHEDKTYKQYEQ